MNKKLLTFLLVILSILLPSALKAQDLPFSDKEQLRIVIHYKWGFSADIAELNVKVSREEKASGPQFYVTANIATFKAWDGLFKIRDFYESRFSATPDLMPVYQHREISEGGYWARNWFSWRDQGRTIDVKVDKQKYNHREFTYTDKDIIRDVISLVFALRSEGLGKMTTAKRVNYPMVLDKDIVTVSFRMIGREKKKIPGIGECKTIKTGISVKRHAAKDANDTSGRFSITGEAGGVANVDGADFYGAEKIFIWFSDDENHIPLYFSAPVAIGSINGRLASYSGLKYPLNSLISN